MRSGCPFELPQSLGAEMCMWALVARPALGHPASGEAALVYIYIYIIVLEGTEKSEERRAWK